MRAEVPYRTMAWPFGDDEAQRLKVGESLLRALSAHDLMGLGGRGHAQSRGIEAVTTGLNLRLPV